MSADSLPASNQSQERPSTSNSQEFKAHAPIANGTKPTEPKMSSSDQSTSGRIYELVIVLLFMATLVFVGLGLQDWKYWLLVPIALTVMIGLSILATHKALERKEREMQDQAKLKYQVTEFRLLTLKTVGVPVDIRRALSRLLTQSPMPADDFLKKVAKDLSWKRINQWREEILIYTRTDNPPTATAVNGQNQPVETTNGKNI